MIAVDSVNNVTRAMRCVVPMEVHCKVCQQPFEPTAEVILAGLWRVCEACRADGAPGSRPDKEDARPIDPDHSAPAPPGLARGVSQEAGRTVLVLAN